MKTAFRFLKMSALIAIAAIAFVPSASARRVFVHGGFGFGPAYYGYWGPGPYYAGWGPAYMYGYPYQPTVGEVKIDTKMKDASVYVDGALAGPVTEMKKMNLTPGTHNIELRGPQGNDIFQENVAVVAGRTLKLHV